jgi:hypothetical protein
MSGPLIEKIGGLTFRDGVLVSSFDERAAFERRGGLDKMFEESKSGNALLARLVKAAAWKGTCDFGPSTAGMLTSERQTPMQADRLVQRQSLWCGEPSEMAPGKDSA